MNKKIKIWMGIIVTIILIGTGGKIYIDKKAAKEHAILVEIVKEHENLVKQDLHRDDKYHRIKSITVDYNTIELNPMNGIQFRGIVNNNKKLYFVAMIYEEDSGKFESAGTDLSGDLDYLLEKKDKESL